MTTKEQDQTNELIHRLAQDADIGRRPYRALLPRILALTVVALALSLVVVALVFGVRADIVGHALAGIYLFKVLAMTLFACAGVHLVWATGTPGASVKPLLVLLPAILVLVAGAVIDDSNFSLMGARKTSVPTCVGAIVLASLPGFALLLGALRRRAASTQPLLSGAVAGLLAGALGAIGYTISCINDGAAFVLVWYTLALLIMTFIGAVIGRRALAW